MAISELANMPIIVKMNGNDYKIQRLSIRDIWGMADNKIIQDYYRSVQEISSHLPQIEKVAYLKDATRNVPRGSELHESRSEFLQSVDGIAALMRQALNKLQTVSEDEIINIIIKDSESVEFVINYLMGISSEDKPLSDPSIPSDPKKK